MTIEIPTPSADLISQIETATIEAGDSETQAIAALRSKFALYAKHNGFIKIADYDMRDSNYSIDRKAYYLDGSRKVRGLLAYDGFDTEHTDPNRGTRGGQRLYLIDTVSWCAGPQWMEVKRVGHWTKWQGEAQWWYSTVESARAIEFEPDQDDWRGEIRFPTDEQVAAEYELQDVIDGLAKSMADMCTKLPERYSKLKARAELAQGILAAAKEVR